VRILTAGSQAQVRPQLARALRGLPADFQTWSQRVAIALGFAIPLSTAADGILSALLLLLWLSGGRYREKLEAIRASPVAIAALAMLAIIVAGLLWGHAPFDERLAHLRKYGNLILIPVLISVPIDEVSRRRALLAFTFAMGITVLLSFALAASLLPEWSWIKGTSQDPNVFKSRITQGLLLVFAVLAAYTLAYTSSRRWFRALMAALAIAAAVNVLTMLQSRTGYVVLLTVLALLLFARFRWKGLLALTLLAAVAFAMLYQRSERFHQRMAEVTSEFAEWQSDTRAQHSVVYRMEFYTNTLRIIAAHPLVGVGTGGFRTAYREQVQGTTMVPTANPHNLYLLVASETGILGLTLLLWLLLRLWRWAAMRLSPPSVSLAARGLVLMYAVAGLFNALLIDHTESVLFGWAAGLLFAVSPVRPKAGLNLDECATATA
jgi:O-antigen ligase